MVKEISELDIKMKGIMESQHTQKKKKKKKIAETQITEIQHKLSENLQNHQLKEKIKINKKLNYLYQRRIYLPNTSNKYFNLSYQTHRNTTGILKLRLQLPPLKKIRP